MPLPEPQLVQEAARLAVVVGVDDCGDRCDVPPLRYAVKDAVGVARVLERHSYQVTTLLQDEATHNRVIEALEKIRPGHGRADGTVIFFFAGHGFEVKGTNHLMTHGADIKKLPQTALSVTAVMDLLKASGIKQQIIFLDACRVNLESDDAETRARSGTTKAFRDFAASEGLRLLASTRPGGFSYETVDLAHGVFTHFLINSLCGAGIDEEARILFENLATHVTKNVRDWSIAHKKDQTPFVSGEHSGDFEISARPTACQGLRCPVSMPPENPQPGEKWEEPALCMAMRWIPAGVFEMGSPNRKGGAERDEGHHRVYQTSSFWIGETEVTQAQWQDVMANNPARFQRNSQGDLSHEPNGAPYPVENITWYEAVLFMNRLSWRAGLDACYETSGCSERVLDGHLVCSSVIFKGLGCRGYRLPTEAEWEYAARAGTRGLTYIGALGGNDFKAPNLGKIAWYGGNSGMSQDGVDCSDWPRREDARFPTCGTQKIGSKPANPWGLYDMLGNVWEWAQDSADKEERRQLVVTDTYKHGEQDPLGRQGMLKIRRGCGWNSVAEECRAANRDAFDPREASYSLGLRVARTAN